MPSPGGNHTSGADAVPSTLNADRKSVEDSSIVCGSKNHNHQEAETTPSNGSRRNRPKRGWSESAEDGSDSSNTISNENPPPENRKKIRRVKESQDGESSQMFLVKRLDMLHQRIESQQRMAEAILDVLLTQKRTLIFEFIALAEKESDIESKEDAIAQARRIFEIGFINAEEQVRTLVASMAEDAFRQQCSVTVIKRTIQQYRSKEGAEKDGPPDHSPNTAGIESGSEAASRRSGANPIPLP